MAEPEIELLARSLESAENYLEFGCGGSTVLACQTVRKTVTSVDSSRVWVKQIGASCRRFPIRPRLFHIDIGPVKDWGRPADESRRSDWPKYHSEIWWNVDAMMIDFCLVDGRFRVACFLQALLRLRPDARIAIHDFRNRPQYHAVLDHAEEIASAETLSIFTRKSNFERSACSKTLERYWFEKE